MVEFRRLPSTFITFATSYIILCETTFCFTRDLFLFSLSGPRFRSFYSPLNLGRFRVFC